MREGYYGPVRLEAGSILEHAFIAHDIRERRRGLLLGYLQVADHIKDVGKVLDELQELSLGKQVKKDKSVAEQVAWLRGLRNVNWLEFFSVREGADEVAKDRKLKQSDPFLKHYV